MWPASDPTVVTGEGAAEVAHAIIVGNLVRALGNLLAERPFVVVPRGVKVAFPIGEGWVWPDVCVVRDRPELVGDVIANPWMVAEVISDSTELFDRGEKFRGYRSTRSVAACWFVASARVLVECWDRGLDSWVLREAGRGEQLRLDGIDGAVGVDDIYRQLDEVRAS